jgi:3-hydroxyisobutyrate dehydrogenase
MVADDEASARVWHGGDGALSTIRPGALAIECSTLSHGHVLRLASDAAAKGATYIDCPVNGPPVAAAKGQLVLLVGAAPADLERAKPLLDALSGNILHFGAIGTGTAFKLINNLLGAVQIAGLAEGVALAHRLGLDRETLIAAIESGPCASPHVKRIARSMVEERIAEVPALSIGLREKDTRYCLMQARDQTFDMPVGKAAYAWYEAAKPSLGAEDDSALLATVTAGRQGGALRDF